MLPADPSTTPAQEAELHFYVGWSKLLSGELFKVAPLGVEGQMVLPQENVQAAVIDFQTAESLNPNFAGYKLALARAYYYLGDKTNAVVKANEAIGLDPEFTRTVDYDVATVVSTNTMQNALFDRGGFDDLQPLPSLDFLDPKYYGRSGAVESSIYIQKIEEAHLIIAEAALSDGNLSGAQTSMTNTYNVVQTRIVETFSDDVEDRTDDFPGTRPDKTTVAVRYGSEPFRTGLILDRKAGDVSVPTISGTSLTPAIINAYSGLDEALEGLYLMRQEIFIAEFRRFTDLGIKMPIPENEQLTNTNVSSSDVLSAVPAFLPTDMDEIVYDVSTGECTITHNMNNILVQNKASTEVLPFH